MATAHPGHGRGFDTNMTFSSFEADLIKGLPAAFVALIIGVIAASIAYRQYEVARTKLKLDLFDKRYAIFEEIADAILSVAHDGAGPPTGEVGAPFFNLRTKAAFLFGDDVDRYLALLCDRWNELWSLGQPSPGRRATSQEDREKAGEIRAWFNLQISQSAHGVFGKYLSFNGWS